MVIKGNDFRKTAGVNSVDPLYDIVTFTNNTALCTWKLIREQILNVLGTKKYNKYVS